MNRSPEFSSEKRSITTLGEFSSEAGRLIDSGREVEARFDELCRANPELAEEYLEALAADHQESTN